MNKKKATPSRRDLMKDICDNQTQSDLMLQLAEECSELAQAALKMNRVLERNGQTPVTYADARQQLTEEIADVLVCMDTLLLKPLIVYDDVQSIMDHKTQRWWDRLNGVEC